MNFLRRWLEWYESGKLLGFPGFDDPETIENQCAGQWVVCLTCHHSISVLGRKSTPWNMVLGRGFLRPFTLWGGSEQHMHGDWGFSIRLAIQAGSCMITPRSVYWWSLFLCHCTQEHWNRLIARVFSNGADTSPQHKQTNKQLNWSPSWSELGIAQSQVVLRYLKLFLLFSNVSLIKFLGRSFRIF